MRRPLTALLVALAIPILAAGKPTRSAPADPLPVGKWEVVFANGVVETCEVRRDGSAHEVEPRRNARGRMRALDGAVVVFFDDDRAERWHRAGRGWVVEHWYPVSRYPAGRPVVGVAKRK
jgi:hypothetical protein